MGDGAKKRPGKRWAWRVALEEDYMELTAIYTLIA